MAFRGDFEAIDEASVITLIANSATEGTMLEFKRQSYGGSDEQKKEFLKDVTALANTLGGHLVIGLDEVDSIANEITPLTGDPDTELQRLENLLRDGVDPRIVGLRMKAVPVEGGFVIVIRSPKSLQAPHRVSLRNGNRFYARNSAGAYELSVQELRAAFTAQATSRERADAWRAERLALIAAGEGQCELNLANGALVVHIVPVSAFAGGQVDVEEAKANGPVFAPIDPGGYSPRLNFDGFISVERDISYTQVFRSGALEAVVTGSIVTEYRDVRMVSAPWLQTQVVAGLARYLIGLNTLDVTPPALLGISLLNVAGARVHPGGDDNRFLTAPPPAIRSDRLVMPAIMLDNWMPMPDMRVTLRPAFDALWHAAGASRAHMFDDDGNWRVG